MRLAYPCQRNVALDNATFCLSFLHFIPWLIDTNLSKTPGYVSWIIWALKTKNVPLAASKTVFSPWFRTIQVPMCTLKIIPVHLSLTIVEFSNKRMVGVHKRVCLSLSRVTWSGTACERDISYPQVHHTRGSQLIRPLWRRFRDVFHIHDALARNKQSQATEND